jgi:DNA repair protein RecO (recombination protein O)
MLKKDQAVCLRKADYSETSQVVTLFTMDSGKISAIAKGAKRKKSAFDGPIEVFAFGDIVFAESQSEKLATLTEFQQKPTFLNLRKDLFGLNCAFFAAELMEAFTHENDPHKELFENFVRFLNDVQDAEDDFNSLALLILFQLALLNDIGSKPVLNGCSNCKASFNSNWDDTYFSSLANGFICPDCEQAFADKIRLSKNCTACLADIKLISGTNTKTLDEIEKVLVYHFAELMHRAPKMAKYFLKKQSF